MEKTSKVAEVAALLGYEGNVQDDIFTFEQSEFILTLSEKDTFLEAEILYKSPCPPELMGKAAVCLAKRNSDVALSGFFMDENGIFGQRHAFSKMDESANIAFAVFIMARTAVGNAICA